MFVLNRSLLTKFGFVGFCLLVLVFSARGVTADSVWQFEAVPALSSNYSGAYTLYNDQPYFVLIDNSSDETIDKGKLSIQYKNQSGWQTEAISPTECQVMTCGSANYYTYIEPKFRNLQIQISQSGDIHIAYQNESTNNLIYLTNESGSWVYTVVTDTTYQSEFDLALNPQGTPRIMYVDRDKEIYFAVPTATGWVKSLVPTGNDHIHINIDFEYAPNGYPHLVYQSWEPDYDIYYDDSQYSLYNESIHTRYTYKDASGWHTETLNVAQFNTYSPFKPKLQLSTNSDPHIIYLSPNDSKLMYQYKNQSWQEEEISLEREYSSDGILDFQLDLDLSNKPIVYLEEGSYFSPDIKLAKRNELGTWDFSTVFTSLGNQYFFGGMLLDSEDAPHVYFLKGADYSPLDWFYFTPAESVASSNWEKNAFSSTAGALTKIIFNGNEVNVTYRQDSSLIQMTGESIESASSVNITKLLIDDAYISFDSVIDNAGDTHVAYLQIPYDYDQPSTIFYLKKESGAAQWPAPSLAVSALAEEEYDYRSNYGIDPYNLGLHALALNPDGLPRIAYSKESELWYAVSSAGAWSEQAIPNEGHGSSAGVSLIYDRTGYPHLAYRDATGEKAMYTYRNSLGWHTEEIVVPATVTENFVNKIVMQMDEDDVPHVAYLMADSNLSTLFYKTDTTLIYAARRATGWHSKIVATTDSTNNLQVNEFDFLLDRNGEAHVAFQQLPQDPGLFIFTKCELLYASEKESWEAEIIDDFDCAGLAPSLAVSTQGDVYVSYYESLDDETKVAVKRNPFATKVYIPILVR